MTAQPEMDFEAVITPPPTPVPASVFSSALGEKRKRDGMVRAAAVNPFLDMCREAVLAAALKRLDKTATADDAARYLESVGLPADSLGNAAGSLFKGDVWIWTGRFQPSERTSRHRNQIRVWQLQ